MNNHIQRIGAPNRNYSALNLWQIPADFNKFSLIGLTLLITKSARKAIKGKENVKKDKKRFHLAFELNDIEIQRKAISGK